MSYHIYLIYCYDALSLSYNKNIVFNTDTDMSIKDQGLALLLTHLFKKL